VQVAHGKYKSDETDFGKPEKKNRNQRGTSEEPVEK
jgi:hypothetical protein